MKRYSAIFLLISSLLFLVPAPSFRVAAEQKPADQTNTKSLALSGLHDSVTVRRDERGIPYIDE
jgi:acyl-homoserine lactone acylase PvdQ